ncbi:MAG: hypothetical protein ABL907_01975 [Hyphomicrobium sp.]
MKPEHLRREITSLHDSIDFYAREKRLEEESATQDLERAKSYTTLVISLGYAGMLTVWNFTSELVPDKVKALTGIMAGISLVSFVIFEVLKMFVMQRNAVLRFRLLGPRPSFEDAEGVHRFAEALRQRREEFYDSKAATTQWLVALWPFFFYPSVILGFGAMFLLLYNLLAHLTGLVKFWPV